MSKRLQHLLFRLHSEDLQAHLARGAAGTIVLKVASTLLSFAVAILLARALGPEGYGIYGYALALITLMAVPAQLGLPTLVVREVASSHIKERWGPMRGILLRANQTVLLFTFILAAVSGVIAWGLADRFTFTQLYTFIWALVLLPLIALGNLRGAALRGLRRVVQGQLPEHLLRPGLLLLFIGVIALTGSQALTPVLAMALHVVAAFVAFGVGAMLLMRAIPKPVRIAVPVYETRTWIASALPLSFIAGMQIINYQIDVVILGLFTSAEAVGIYRVAVHGAGLVSFTLGAINMVISPHIACLYTAGDHERLQRMITWSARAIFAGALPVAMAFVLFGESILGTVFSREFTGGYWALVILCVGQLVNAAMGSVIFILNMTGHERDAAWGVSVAAVANILLNLALIPPFGMEGAAVATAASFAIWNIMLTRRVFQRTGLISTAFGRVGRERAA